MGILERFNITGRNALVTGAGRGLGRAFALALAEAGANVAVIDIDPSNASRVAEEICASGREGIMFEADVSRWEEFSDIVNEIIKTWGALDVAVNNAGIALEIKDAVDVTTTEWDHILDLNLRGTFFCCQAEAKVMIPRGYGKIINIASICAYIVWPDYQAVYSSSKAGLRHLTRCLAAEWIRHGIRVNSISPGVTRTPELFEEVVPVFLNKAPIDRVASVEDLQAAVIYLASEASDFMVGNDLIIDGGYTLF
jgi:NAD(P)-dependent dehydrogenase (short-subunit alcohol dehydrogenase family)